MKQLGLGVRALAVLATSSAVVFTAPATFLVSASAQTQRSPNDPERPAAARLHHLRPATTTPDGGAFFALDLDLDLEVEPSPPPDPPPGRMTPEETPANVKGRHCSGDVACFLVCTRAHESDSGDANGNGMFDAGYGAVSADGSFRGAYQFLRSTWDSTARGMGRSDLVGVDPALASPADQDAAAAALYGSAGSGPWGGRC